MSDHGHELAEAINHLTAWLKSHADRPATKHDLEQLKETIMSAISDFNAKLKVHNDKLDAAVAGLTADVANLTDQIAKLQATQGQITPEDQAILDAIEVRAATISDKLAALDALTPPVPPQA